MFYRERKFISRYYGQRGDHKYLRCVEFKATLNISTYKACIMTLLMYVGESQMPSVNEQLDSIQMWYDHAREVMNEANVIESVCDASNTTFITSSNQRNLMEFRK